MINVHGALKTQKYSNYLCDDSFHPPLSLSWGPHAFKLIIHKMLSLLASPSFSFVNTKFNDFTT